MTDPATARELYALRNRVARAARALRPSTAPQNPRQPQYGSWSAERESAGTSALAALREAVRRNREKP